jgi:RNA polymerase sigma factor CnrH
VSGHSKTEEQELVTKVIAGDRLAFTQLVKPHLPRLLATSARMLGAQGEAEDAVQNVLASAWIARARLDPGRAVLPLLTTMTLNKCRDRLRRRKAAQFLGFGGAQEPELAPDLRPSPETEATDRQALLQTFAEIDRLPGRLREALVLVAIDGRSHAEAAALLGITEKAIEALVYRARRTLRKKLDLE